MFENQAFNKLLLENLRIFAIQINNKIPLDDARLAKAMTINENLRSYGYILSPKDIALLAGLEDMDKFWEDFKGLVPDVKAEPMYPDFPKQVMVIDEATFRFHQMVHYFSTYEMEAIFGINVNKGWLPDMPKTKKIVEDKSLLDAKVISLMNIEEVPEYAIRKILSKRERMTVPENMIVATAVVLLGENAASVLKDINITFKENLLGVSYTILKECDREISVLTVAAMCQHAGDALRICDYFIGKCGYRLHTSQKRTLVRLLEQFSAIDLRSNLVLSGKKSKRTHIVLNYTDFTEYCTKPELVTVVNEFRDGGIKSWESQMKSLLTSDKDEALRFIATKPGMMLRMVSWLLRLGYTREDIMKELSPKAEKLSMQTLVTNLNLFGSDMYMYEKHDKDEIYDIFLALLQERMKSIATPLAGKRVFVSEEGYSFDESTIECNSKSEEGGYIRSGIAYKLPEDAKSIRFFVYWNDAERVDIDLHAYGIDKNGENIHIGWNADFNESGVVFSGDITHSDAAEYIDALTDGMAVQLSFDICSYTRKAFKNIETCFVGVMAVSELGEEVKLYDPKNCFFYHELKTNEVAMRYGYIDLQKHVIVFVGKPMESRMITTGKFNVSAYLRLLAKAQNFEIVDDRDIADSVVVMGKAKEDEISLIDNNFFLDA